VQKPKSRFANQPLGAILRAQGLIDDAQLEQALRLRRERNIHLGQALIELGFVDEGSLAQALAEQGRLASIRLHAEAVDVAVARRVDEGFARARHLVPINEIAGVVTVVMEDPADLCIVDDVARLLGRRILPVFAPHADIEHALDHAFLREQRGDALEQMATSAEVDGHTFDTTLLEKAERLDESDESHPVVGLLKGILNEAFKARASDIHLETRRSVFQVRFRVDGALFDRLSLPKGWARPTLSRLKILASLDIAQHLLPQDGRAQIDIDGRSVDLRVATTPTLLGESAVVRILDGGRELQSLSKLGLSELQEQMLKRAVEASEGFVLATGPTGSGKTTTLYALLKHLHTPDQKIITLEDPVENYIDGLTQINTHAKAGLTFSRGLRSILRQDPDIVLVGEIRDEETAEIATQAALTGHLVLSTLHTVGTAESITRLAEMGVERFLLADTLRGLVAQRLVRRICEHCKAPEEPDLWLCERLGTAVDGATFFEGKGCRYCNNSGFYGRVGIYEVMVLESDLVEAVRGQATTRELRALAVRQGMTTLREEALRKARAGQTTLREVLQATAFAQ
jgi:type IV pilus assembly protein PilB